MLVGNLVLVERLTQLAMFDMRNQLFRKTLQMEMAHFGDGHSSHMMHRINSDVNCAFNGVNVALRADDPGAAEDGRLPDRGGDHLLAAADRLAARRAAGGVCHGAADASRCARPTAGRWRRWACSTRCSPRR